MLNRLSKIRKSKILLNYIYLAIVQCREFWKLWKFKKWRK